MEKGIGIFGKQYEIMFMNDSHAAGSVDIVLMEQMVKLDSNTIEFLYNSYTDRTIRYKPGNRAVIEAIVNKLKGHTDSDTVDNIIHYCSRIVENCNTDIENMVFGGSEEEIISRGTDWCTDIARVACIMFQIAKLPSRIVITANTKFAYCGHVVTEVFYDKKWGVADPTNGVVIRHMDKSPASAWEIQNNCDIANRIFYEKNPDRSDFFTPGEQYESVGITNYYVDEQASYNYETSRVNDYYRKLLLYSGEGWKGGIRWVNGEDNNYLPPQSICPV